MSGPSGFESWLEGRLWVVHDASERLGESDLTEFYLRGSFDHIRVPEDFAGALPSWCSWAGCDKRCISVKHYECPVALADIAARAKKRDELLRK